MSASIPAPRATSLARRAFLLASAASVAAAGVVVRPAAPLDLGEWPLAGQVAQSLSDVAGVPLLTPTGLTNADYLDTIEGIVRGLLPLQAASGAIVDPYRGIETQYSTPCFAHAAATVAPRDASGVLAKAAALALDRAVEELVTQTTADGHANFFVLPTTFAYALLAPTVAPERAAGWLRGLLNMSTAQFVSLAENWGMVATVGDFYR